MTIAVLAPSVEEFNRWMFNHQELDPNEVFHVQFPHDAQGKIIDKVYRCGSWGTMPNLNEIDIELIRGLDRAGVLG